MAKAFFNLITPSQHVWLRTVTEAELDDALKTLGTVDTETLALGRVRINVVSGEWLYNDNGTWKAATDGIGDALAIGADAHGSRACPVWEAAGTDGQRTDAEGGLTVVEGNWVAWTNMVGDADGTIFSGSDGDELQLGALDLAPGVHDTAVTVGRDLNGLIARAAAASIGDAGDVAYINAVVEQKGASVAADGALIRKVGYAVQDAGT